MCPQCATPNSPSAPFCIKCGMEIGEIEPSENMFYPMTINKPRKMSTFSFWAYRSALVLIQLTIMSNKVSFWKEVLAIFVIIILFIITLY